MILGLARAEVANARSNCVKVLAATKGEPPAGKDVDCGDEFSVDKNFEVLWVRPVVRIDNVDDAKARKLDQTLVRVARAIADKVPYAADHLEVLGITLRKQFDAAWRTVHCMARKSN